MQPWIVNNEAGQEAAELLIYGPIIEQEGLFISGAGAKELAVSLMELGSKPINLRINSFGGSVFAGHAMMNALKAYPGEVTAYVDGIAASAAVLPALGADKLIMPANSMLMIHNPAVGLDGQYEAGELEKMRNSLIELKSSIISAYKTKTKLSEQELAEIMDQETWLTAQTAKEYGFADEVRGLVNLSVSNNILNANGETLPLDKIPAKLQLVNYINLQNKPKEEQSKMDKNQELAERLSNNGELSSQNPPQVPKVELNLAGLNLAEFKNQLPGLYNQVFEAGRQEGEQKERERLKEIDNIAKDFPQDLTNKAKYEELKSAEALALEFFKNGGSVLNAMKAEVLASGAQSVASETNTSLLNEQADKDALINAMAGGAKIGRY